MFCFFPDIADSLDEGSRIDGVVKDFFKEFDLVLHDRLINKIDKIGLGGRVVVRIREFLRN